MQGKDSPKTERVPIHGIETNHRRVMYRCDRLQQIICFAWGSLVIFKKENKHKIPAVANYPISAILGSCKNTAQHLHIIGPVQSLKDTYENVFCLP
jgi:hypothetical protein